MDEHTCDNCLHHFRIQWKQSHTCQEHDRDTQPGATCPQWTCQEAQHIESLCLPTHRGDLAWASRLVDGSLYLLLPHTDASRHNFALSPAAARQLREWLQKTEEDAP